MKKIELLFPVMLLVLFRAASAAGELSIPVLSYLPSDSIEMFIVEHLDLRTFRNFILPQVSIREHGRFFSDFNEYPTSILPDQIIFDTESSYIEIAVLERRDINGDGIEDLQVRWTAWAKGGSYSTEQFYLLTRYSEEGNLIAISFEP